MKIAFTHKGWFGLCPIYMKDIDTDCPMIEPRIPLTGWLIDVSEFIYGTCIWVATTVNPEHEPLWPMLITGKLASPKLIEVDDK